MNKYEYRQGMFDFVHLPDYAAYLLKDKIKELSECQVEKAFQFDIPLLKKLEGWSHQQLVDVTIAGYQEFLPYFIEKRPQYQIKDSMQKWTDDKLEIVGKYDIQAEDITLISHIRQYCMKQFISSFTKDENIAATIRNEIDEFFLASVTAGMNGYITILKEQLQKRENELLEAQSIAKVGSFDWNIRTNTTVHTPQMREIFEYDNKGLENWLSHVHPEDVGRVRKELDDAMKTGYFDSEYRFIVPDKKVKTIWSRSQVFFDENKKPLLMRGTVQDITAWKLIEEELKHKTEQLRNSNEELKQFALVAGHELQEPLKNITMYTDLLYAAEKQKLAFTSLTYINKLKNAGNRLSKMIDDLLQFSFLSHEQDKQKIDLGFLLQESMDLLEQSIREKEVMINYSNLPTAEVIPSAFRQLFKNLITASLLSAKKTERPEFVINHRWVTLDEESVDAFSNEKNLEITFTDNGEGHAQNDIATYLKAFKMDKENNLSGIGMALSISNKIAGMHGGNMKIYSKKGQGSTIIVTIPQ